MRYYPNCSLRGGRNRERGGERDEERDREMRRSLIVVLAVIGASGLAFAAGPSVPEIGPASGVGALVLFSGALLVIRGRRKSGK